MSKFFKNKDQDDTENWLKIIAIAIIGGLLIAMLILFFFLITHVPAEAKDFGVVGKVDEIKEKDAIEEIKDKLRIMEQNGQLDEHNQNIKEKTTKAIRNPTHLNIKKAQENRVYSYDPTIEVKEDLKDDKGQIFQKNGTKVNPLDTVSMPYELIFFDANDKEQIEFAIEKYNSAEIKPKLILTGGSVIELEEKYGLDVYFDQSGVLIKKLGISGVPAIISQKDKMLEIMELRLHEKQSLSNEMRTD